MKTLINRVKTRIARSLFASVFEEMAASEARCRNILKATQEQVQEFAERYGEVEDDALRERIDDILSKMDEDDLTDRVLENCDFENAADEAVGNAIDEAGIDRMLEEKVEDFDLSEEVSDALDSELGRRVKKIDGMVKQAVEAATTAKRHSDMAEEFAGRTASFAKRLGIG